MTGTGSPLGAPAERREGRQKVTGSARYAAEHPLPGRAHAWPVPATIARGRVTAVDTAAALDLPGVLTVLTHEDAPRIADPDDPTLAVLQDPRVPHRAGASHSSWRAPRRRPVRPPGRSVSSTPWRSTTWP